MDSSGISFTALYTGQVWYEYGMSNHFFTNAKSKLLFEAMRPFEFAAKHSVGVNLEDILLQRHKIIDHIIEQRMLKDGVSQILEIACGYSPRGYKLSQRHPNLTYIEADLPKVAKQKNRLLNENTHMTPGHKVVSCDIFSEHSSRSLNNVITEFLNPNQPTIIITEGLVNYFTLENISLFWRKLVTQHHLREKAWYVTDMAFAPNKSRLPSAVRSAGAILSLATGSSISFHFRDEHHLLSTFNDYSFQNVTLHSPADYQRKLRLPNSKNKSLMQVVEAQIPAEVPQEVL